MNDIIFTGWVWHPSVLVGLTIWTSAYILAIGHFRVQRRWGPPASRAQQVSFHLGTGLALLALVSPLDSLGDKYLLSAHMIQHLLLMFIVAPLWLMGIPGWLIEQVHATPISNLTHWITRPTPAFMFFTGTMIFWHIPAVYDFALNNEAIHISEHLSFIGAALIGWWPVLAEKNSLTPPQSPQVGILYLFLLAVPMTAFSAVLTFASAPLYEFYLQAPRLFGMGVLEDQHLGGLLMWVPAHMVLLLVLGVTFQRWLVDEEKNADLAFYANSHSRS